ncbi:MAG: restriction endonuclease subunit S [Brevinematales bacterium]|nr:restriction endonuclease subunit S [Brevinematales bacterium]
MTRKPYPKVKPSGTEWLGDVPEKWDIQRLKYCLSLNSYKTETNENTLALENIESWTGNYIDTDSFYEGEGIAFREGDILFGKLRPYLAKVYLSKSFGEAIGDLFVLRPFKHLYPEYASYLLRTKTYIDIIDGSTYGAKMPRVNWEFMGNLPFPLPPLAEQQAIASYLDRETAKIDALIAKNRELIALLAENRSALISRAVTKGLDPNAKMKPSGVEWLGDVPEGWEVKKGRYIFNFISGGTPSTENPDYWDGEISWVSSKDMKSKYIVDTEDHISNIAIEESATNLIPKDTLLMVLRSGILQHSIPACIITKEMAINQDIKALIPKIKLSPLYYGSFIHAHQKQLLTIWRKAGATVDSLDLESIKNFLFPVPPYKEQQAIAEYLDRETAKIDALSGKVETVIGKLAEYRSALTGAAVTGKIDVRG